MCIEMLGFFLYKTLQTSAKLSSLGQRMCALGRFSHAIHHIGHSDEGVVKYHRHTENKHKLGPNTTEANFWMELCNLVSSHSPNLSFRHKWNGLNEKSRPSWWTHSCVERSGVEIEFWNNIALPHYKRDDIFRSSLPVT